MCIYDMPIAAIPHMCVRLFSNIIQSKISPLRKTVKEQINRGEFQI